MPGLLASPLAGRHACDAAEEPCEIVDVGDAAGCRNILHGNHAFLLRLLNLPLLNRFLIHIKQHSTCFVNRFFTIFNVLVILFKFSIVLLCTFTLSSFCLRNQSTELRDNSAFSSFFCHYKLKRFLFRFSRLHFSLLFTIFYLYAALFPRILF